jgi:hypothetical protein
LGAPLAAERQEVGHRGQHLLGALHCPVLLPNADRAEIQPAKIRDYLLSSTHPIGRFKARSFRALGFSPDRWEELEAALRAQHLTQKADPGASAVAGQKFTIRAILNGPAGESAMVVSVWFIAVGETVPRFVTAYPGEHE